MGFTVIKEKLPVYWASFLVNGVKDSLEQGEEKQIAETLEHLELTGCTCVDVLDDAHFHKPWKLNWLLAGDFATFIFHKEEN
tara:strand:+ start:151 stop:396 length:246 start_codon:yes stop_codon:yes gene_type:complete